MAMHPRRHLAIDTNLVLDRDDGLPLIMGIVNVTPDSFSDGGSFLEPQAAIDHALRLEAEGADLIDIGAESSRPGADAVTPQQEWQRLEPVIEALTARLNIPVSVDTYHIETARRSVAAGARMLNDISAGRASEDAMLALAAETGVPICLMHMQGQPKMMQQAPAYEDVVAEVDAFLLERCATARELGVEGSRLIVDPGFGFGKQTGHNVQLVRNLWRFRKHGLVLMGLSRKRSLVQLSGANADHRRLPESVAGAIVSALQGADILRVHDVGETIRALRVAVPLAFQ